MDQYLDPLKNQSLTSRAQERLLKMPFNKKSIEWIFFAVCRDGKFLGTKKTFMYFSRFLHHNNPFLKLGPFKEERNSHTPYSVIFHDILSEMEISFLINKSKGNLTKIRKFDVQNSGALNKHELNSGQRRRVIAKSVTHWIREVEFKQIVEEKAGNY